MPSHRPPPGPAPLRRLLRALRSSAWAALMLALALGTLLALFSLFDQVVLRPQPGAAAARHANTAWRGLSLLEPGGRTATQVMASAPTACCTRAVMAGLRDSAVNRGRTWPVGSTNSSPRASWTR